MTELETIRIERENWLHFLSENIDIAEKFFDVERGSLTRESDIVGMYEALSIQVPVEETSTELKALQESSRNLIHYAELAIPLVREASPEQADAFANHLYNVVELLPVGSTET